MLIPINLRYDPAKNPKVDAWIKQREAKGENVSEHIRRAIEADHDQESILKKADDDRKKLQDDVQKLFAEVERLKAGVITRPQPEQAEIIEIQEIEKKVEKIAEHQEIEVNVNALRNRYFKEGE
jgi:hypothetical protein